MNRIQQISHDIETRRMKRRMGLDPAVEIDRASIRQMWQDHAQRSLNERLGRQYRGGEFETLPRNPDFLRED